MKTKKLGCLIFLFCAFLSACSENSAVRPAANGDVNFFINNDGSGAPAGDVAPAIDPNPALQQQLAAAQASLVQKEQEMAALIAQLEALQAGGNSKDEDIEVIKRGLQAAQNDAIEAQLEVERLKAELERTQAQLGNKPPEQVIPAGEECKALWQEQQQALEPEFARLNRQKATIVAAINTLNSPGQDPGKVAQELPLKQRELANIDAQIATLQDYKLCIDALVQNPQCRNIDLQAETAERNEQAQEALPLLCDAVGQPLGQ